MDRLSMALELIQPELTKEAQVMIAKIMEVDADVNCMDYSNWEEYYYRQGEDSLIEYLREVFKDERI